MISSLVRFVRPAAAVVAVLLVGGALPSAPAAAAPVRSELNATFLLTGRVVYPAGEVAGPPGDTPGEPADAGPAPGSVTVSVQLENQGEDALHDFTVTTRVRTNGRVDTIRCATTPLAPDGSPRSPGTGEPQQPSPGRVPSPRPSATQLSAQGGASLSWTDASIVLATYDTLFCLIEVSGIAGDFLHQEVTDASAVGVSSGEPVNGSKYLWAAAGDRRPAPPAPISIGYLVWVDLRPDNYQSIDQNEPGIAGLRMTITGPDGLPVPQYPSGVGVVGPQTTSRTGTYHFRQLRPWTTYTVNLDLSSPSLANLVKSSHSPGEVSADGSTWSIKVDTVPRDESHVNFGFVAKDPLKLTVNAPAAAVAGTSVQVTGGAWWPGTPRAWDGHAVLEFKAASTTTVPPWTKVADAASRRGKLTTRVTATRSGWFRYRIPGDVATAPALSTLDHLTVTTAPVGLTAVAPTSVRQGAPLTVTGTITRSGEPFQTGGIVLEHSTDASTWTAVAEVRSTDGTLTATVQPARTGSYRYHYLGDSKTAPGTSPVRQVVVSAATTRSVSPRPPR